MDSFELIAKVVRRRRPLVSVLGVETLLCDIAVRLFRAVATAKGPTAFLTGISGSAERAGRRSHTGHAERHGCSDDELIHWTTLLLAFATLPSQEELKHDPFVHEHSTLLAQVQKALFSQRANTGYLMPKMKRWFSSQEDVRTLKALARQKTPAPKIAKSLKRSVGAVRQKALGLSISLNSRA